MRTKAEIEARLAKLQDASHDDDQWPAATELLEWVLSPSPVLHDGKEKDRCDHVYDGWLNKEKIFAEKWKQSNNPPSFLNHGTGTLALLLCTRPVAGPDFRGSGYELYRHLTQEEATAAASAIQWLGTNCGWCWLEECIRACGFDLLRSRDDR